MPQLTTQIPPLAILPAAAEGHQGLPRDPDGRDGGDGRGRHHGHPRAAGPRRARAQHLARLAAHGRDRGPLHRLCFPTGNLYYLILLIICKCESL